MHSESPLPEAELRALLARRFADTLADDWQFDRISGLSGVNWRAKNSDGVTFLLRPSTMQRRQLGIDRRYECQALRLATAAALGPGCQGVLDGWLLADWLAGQPLAAGSPPSARLVSLLVDLHRLPPRLPLRTLRRYCAGYWDSLAPARRTFQAQRIHRRWQRRREPRPLKLTMLHMDIHDGNLIETAQGLRLIDWEYAASGDIALDLAALSRNYGLDRAARRALVADYCRHGGYAAPERLTRQVERWLGWVDYMAWLWFELRWQQSQQPSYRQQADALLNHLSQ
ncbi:phosphotransferase [Edwardsiella tarda]|uniref:Thiamine kinase n=2 Tax=Edwardsiella tarda TaxID=636 RepID=A0A2A7U375_EDWTA|nr:phosphotransferase [Edwardsiella tarda]PEH72862.1 thiamine kinase [Edwardsiella tarda]UAL55082.1 phosphotransferase [Edwardsiella tarda]UCP98857.1 phosphotransferase [Edwardsiella tarda ATCC 15947 = NBRC 105688]STD29605.1 Thiamine kinase [Edwardsiella tarda]BEH72623.1 thiamine kinase [Edwardsiella tarda]